MYTLPFLATVLSITRIVASDSIIDWKDKPLSLCRTQPKCTLGISMWYSIPDGPQADGSTQPASTGEYGGVSINEVIFFDPACENLAHLDNFAPPTEDVQGTLSPPGYKELTLKGTSDGYLVNPFQLSPNDKLETGSQPPFIFTYDGITHKQSADFKDDGTCSGDTCSCTGKKCKRVINGQKHDGFCYSCEFDCKKQGASRIMRA